jgi:hypothetical protein
MRMSRDEFDAAMQAEWRRRARGARAWIALGAVLGAAFLGFFGWAWSGGAGATGPVVGLILGLLLGGGIAWLVVRARARRAAHRAVAARWARDNGWEYAEKVDVPGIDLGFLRQGDRRYCEDGASGSLAGHPAEFANFTVEKDSTDSEGRRQVDYDHYFIVVVHRPWQGPALTMVRRSLSLGRGLRNALRSSATSRKVVEVENDAFAKEFQVTIPDAWQPDVVFLLIPPDMQEDLATRRRLDDVRQVDADPAFLFLAWPKHFSAEDLPLLEARLADVEWLAGRWGDVPPAMRPMAPGGTA